MADDQERIVSGQVVFDVSQVMNQLKELSNTVDQVKRQLTSKPSGTVFLEEFGGTIQTAILKIENAAKRSQISLDDLQKKLIEIQSTYRAAGAFDPSVVGARQAAINDKSIIDAANRVRQQMQTVYKQQQSDQQQLLNEWLKARDAYYKDAETLDKAHYQALQEDTKRNVQFQQQTIDGQLQQIKAFYDMKLSTAEESLAKIEQLMNEETTYFQENQNKRIQALKMAYQMETDMAAQESANSKWAQLQGARSNASRSSALHMNGFGMMNPVAMGSMMVEFTAMNGLLNNISQGFVAIDKSAAGLKQVFGDATSTQSQLNAVTDQFIGIAQQYGTSIQDVMDAAKLWGRQYKDVNTALTLTHNSTILATVDNLSMADANRAVESTMNAMGMAATNQATAFSNSMKIVDSWSALAHEASVSANDLAQGVERSSGAAHQAGLNLDQLNALVAAGVNDKIAPYIRKSVA